jgi:DNA-binding transcriptional MerR regulator
MSIGDFTRRSRLSPKALRLYDGLGLLSPSRVDELSGYRYYEGAQLGQARLIAALRQARSRWLHKHARLQRNYALVS